MFATYLTSISIRKAVAVVVISTTTLSACATGGELKTAGHDDVSDACYAERQPFVEAHTDLASWAIGGAAIGAVAGATAGALIGGDVWSAVAGAAAGAAIGGGAGYLAGKQKQASSREELIASIDGDATTDREQVRVLTNAVTRLGDCRIRQIETVDQQWREGLIPREQAASVVEKIEASIQVDNQLIDEVLGEVDRRYIAYVEAKREVDGLDKGNVLAPTVEDPVEPVVLPPEDFEVKDHVGRYVVITPSNVRKGPSTTFEKIGSLAANEQIDVYGQTPDSQWYTFTYQDQPGFVYASVVQEYEPTDALDDLSDGRRELEVTKSTKEKRLQRHMSALRRILPSASEGVGLEAGRVYVRAPLDLVPGPLA